MLRLTTTVRRCYTLPRLCYSTVQSSINLKDIPCIFHRAGNTCQHRDSCKFKHDDLEVAPSTRKTIAMLVGGGELEQAEQLINRLMESKVLVTANVFTPFLHYYLRMDQLEKVERLIASLKPKYNISPNAEHYNLLLESYAKLKDVKKMSLVLDMMEKNGFVDEDTFSPFFKIYSHKRKFQNAKQLLDDMIHVYKIEPHSRHYVRVIESGIGSVPISSIADLYATIPQKHKNIFVFNTVLDAYKNAFNKGALTKYGEIPMQPYYDEMIKDGLVPDLYTLQTMMWDPAQEGNVKALERVWEMVDKYNLKPDKRHYTLLVLCYITAKDFVTAIKLFDEIDDKDLKLYQTMINGCFKNGEFERGREFLNLMVKSKIDPDGIIMNSMLNGYLNAGKEKEAYALLAEFKKKYQIAPDSHTYEVTLAYKLSQNLDEAIEAFDRIPKRYVSVISYTMLLKQLVNAKRFKDFDYYITQMFKDGVRLDLQTHSMIIKVHLHRGNTRAADQHFNKISERNTLMFNMMLQSVEPGIKIVKLLERMDRENVDKNTETYEIALARLMSVQAMDHVKKVVEQMDNIHREQSEKIKKLLE